MNTYYIVSRRFCYLLLMFILIYSGVWFYFYNKHVSIVNTTERDSAYIQNLYQPIIFPPLPSNSDIVFADNRLVFKPTLGYSLDLKHTISHYLYFYNLSELSRSSSDGYMVFNRRL